MSLRARIVLAVVLAMIAMGLAVAAVLAHGDAAWIDAGGYVNASGTRCCGERDCAIVSEDAAWSTGIGQTIRIELPGRTAIVAVNRIYATGGPHGHPWACVTGCLFRPTGA